MTGLGARNAESMAAIRMAPLVGEPYVGARAVAPTSSRGGLVLAWLAGLRPHTRLPFWGSEEPRIPGSYLGAGAPPARSKITGVPPS